MSVSICETDFTPRCAAGFSKRLEELMLSIGLDRSRFIKFLMEATELSRTATSRILTEDRPPKRDMVFKKLTHALASKLSAQTKRSIQEAEVYAFLVDNKPIASLSSQDQFDISSFLSTDPILTSQIILLVTRVAADHSTGEITEDKIRLINFRIISYCIKNNVDAESEKLRKMIINFLELANEDLI